MATEPLDRAPGADRGGIVERYTRRTRWFHAGVYVTLLIVLATGGWLFFGREGDQSPLAELFGMSDIVLHKRVGYVLAGILAAGLLLGFRGVWTFVKESVRFRATDVRWMRAWPRAVLTGRFTRHEGHFDPGQRILNMLLTVGILVAVGTGLALITVHGGPTFVLLSRLHRWATYLITPLIVGHVLVAAGVLPGYRGAWRSMHLGGRLRVDVARRLWPGWLERNLSASDARSGDERDASPGGRSDGRRDRSRTPREDRRRSE